MHKNGISSGVGGASQRRCAGCAVPLVGTSASVTPSSSGHRGRYLKLGVLVKLSVAQWAQVDTDTDTMAAATRHTTLLALLLAIIVAFVSTLSEARDLTVVTV